MGTDHVIGACINTVDVYTIAKLEKISGISSSKYRSYNYWLLDARHTQKIRYVL